VRHTQRRFHSAGGGSAARVGGPVAFYVRHQVAISRHIRASLIAQAPGHAVLAALERLLALDEYLLKVDANERSISYRFGMYLQSELPDYHVDCEYNRDGVEPKRIGHVDLNPNSEDTEGKTVFPDIIVHIRGEKRNYLVIEFKKSSSTVDRSIDFQKLRGYKGDQRLRYEHALFVELTVGEHPDVARAEWVNA
jgi:hypothetical protein